MLNKIYFFPQSNGLGEMDKLEYLFYSNLIKNLNIFKIILKILETKFVTHTPEMEISDKSVYYLTVEFRDGKVKNRFYYQNFVLVDEVCDEGYLVKVQVPGDGWDPDIRKATKIRSKLEAEDKLAKVISREFKKPYTYKFVIIEVKPVSVKIM